MLQTRRKNVRNTDLCEALLRDRPIKLLATQPTPPKRKTKSPPPDKSVPPNPLPNLRKRSKLKSSNNSSSRDPVPAIKPQDIKAPNPCDLSLNHC
ncbi:unnamed protein product [Rhizophagus irregularis]|uniref:Uncharacterized protein n=1 Tax=Rhizophagus irregularis TaxID=588596 RepID=A0A915Z5N9_9GLOM|nr:unnamed protein product [Rhizophagus irregularis]CAB5187534.1 unnamed protein product [Rhizophagus irregularis]CAB5361667.1 unnamed protein product [Rhizophagus irregularis]